MKHFCILLLLPFFYLRAQAQQNLTAEVLWKLGRVSAAGISTDQQKIVFSVGIPDMAANKINRTSFTIPLSGGPATAISDVNAVLKDKNLSPDGRFLLVARDVKVTKVAGVDFYPSLIKSNVQIYDGLNYRHWDEWEDGAFSHVFITTPKAPATDGKDIMIGQPYDCPQKPFGGDEDYIWSNDGKQVLYVTKPLAGTQYAVSTNTDIFSYDVLSGKTTNLTAGLMGYDVNPAFSKQGTLAWLSMEREGYEADKQDILVMINNKAVNVTKAWDGSVNAFLWSNDGSKLYFEAAIDGTLQLFEVSATGNGNAAVKQITNGDFDVAGLTGQVGNKLYITRTDMNRAAEIFSVDLADGSMVQLTHVNDEAFKNLAVSKVERRRVTTTDGKNMLVYVIYPPGFDATKKYPTLLYCQGGPQSPLTQFYSFRWNFQLMSAPGYIVVAPNRRGMYGYGRLWNEQISKDWGGQVMKDYLSAIDDVSKEPYVDKSRVGCIGASFGGYSVFWLAGNHNNRFKTFISHDGIFNTKSMYGTTEELFFENWEKGGPYWDKKNKVAQKAYNQFSPDMHVQKWNRPMMIVQGGIDYRVPIGQGLEAFQAAQLRGLKSKLVYFATENHWVLQPQNAMVWQGEFFKWLKETL